MQIKKSQKTKKKKRNRCGYCRKKTAIPEQCPYCPLKLCIPCYRVYEHKCAGINEAKEKRVKELADRLRSQKCVKRKLEPI